MNTTNDQTSETSRAEIPSLIEPRAVLRGAQANLQPVERAWRRLCRKYGGAQAVKAVARRGDNSAEAHEAHSIWTELLLKRSEHARALRTFHREAMIAALERVIETDRQIKAAAAAKRTLP